MDFKFTTFMWFDKCPCVWWSKVFDYWYSFALFELDALSWSGWFPFHMHYIFHWCNLIRWVGLMQHELFMIVNVVMKLCYEKMNDHEQKIG